MPYDQHFLTDEKILKKIVTASRLSSKDRVLEVGPGRGILTQALVSSRAYVIVVEIDKTIELPLSVEAHYGNILDLMDSLSFNKIVSNLPYSIMEPFFKKLIKRDIDLAVLMVGTNFFNLFSGDSKWAIIGPLFFDIKKICDVSRESFEPRPRVDSVVVTFKKRTKKMSQTEEIIKEFVLQDDKKVKNALREALIRVKGLTKREAEKKILSKIPLNLLTKNVDYLSNLQFRLVYELFKK